MEISLLDKKATNLYRKGIGYFTWNCRKSVVKECVRDFAEYEQKVKYEQDLTEGSINHHKRKSYWDAFNFYLMKGYCSERRKKITTTLEWNEIE